MKLTLHVWRQRGPNDAGKMDQSVVDRGGDDNPADPYGAAIDYISSIEPGEIAVIGTNESNESAFWGELFSAAARVEGRSPLRQMLHVIGRGGEVPAGGVHPESAVGRLP